MGTREFVIQSQKALIEEQKTKEEASACTKQEITKEGKTYAISPFFGQSQELARFLKGKSVPYTITLNLRQPAPGMRIMEITDVKSTVQTHVFKEGDRCQCGDRLITFPLKCKCENHKRSQRRLIDPATRRSPCAYQASIQIIRTMQIKFLDCKADDIKEVLQRAQAGEIEIEMWDTWIKKLTEGEKQLKKEAEAIAKCKFQ